MRKTDISKYTDKISVTKKNSAAGTTVSVLWKFVMTVLAVLVHRFDFYGYIYFQPYQGADWYRP